MKIRAVFNNRVILLLILLAALAGWPLLSGYFSNNDVRNVLLISIDTCRADYLSCHGYSLKTTPNIDEFASKGFLFSNSYSPVPVTLPAHSSLLTGTIPLYHGVHDNNDYKLAESNETLAEILHSNGFTTAAVVGAFVMHSKYGLKQGFDNYNCEFKESGSSIGIDERRGEDVNRSAFEWLDKNKNKKFFLFLHYYDPHISYDPPEPFASRFRNNLYAGEIAYVDHCIGQVLNKLKADGVYEKTLIVITSDHGEMLGDHGEPTHSYFIYQKALHVPLVFKIPGQDNGKRLGALASLIDIVPTICGTLGIKIPEHVQGEDLSGYFKEDKIPVRNRRLYCESLIPTKYGAGPLLGVITDRWKYIRTKRPELYDLVKDPEEAINQVKQQPETAQSLLNHLKTLVEGSIHSGKPGGNIYLDQEDRKRLESLGYLAGTQVRDDFEFDPKKEDPKDLIGFHNQLMNAYSFAFNKHDYKEATAICKKLLEDHPGDIATYDLLTEIALQQDELSVALSYLKIIIDQIPKDAETLKINPKLSSVYFKMGSIHKKKKDTNEAVDLFFKALSLNPDMPEAYFELGVIFQEQGKEDKAIDNFSKALQLYADIPEAHYNLGVIFLGQGKTDEAIKKFLDALEIKPDYAEAHNNLGVAFHRKGISKEAINHYHASLKINPDQPMVYNHLGVVLQNQDKIDDAIKCFSKSLQMDPNSEKAHNNLGIALFKKGDSDKAISHFRTALALKPDYAVARDNLKAALATKGHD